MLFLEPREEKKLFTYFYHISHRLCSGLKASQLLCKSFDEIQQNKITNTHNFAKFLLKSLKVKYSKIHI
jgi:hypothetical protein